MYNHLIDFVCQHIYQFGFLQSHPTGQLVISVNTIMYTSSTLSNLVHSLDTILPVRTAESMGKLTQDEATRPKVCCPGAYMASLEPPRHIPEIVAGRRTSNWGAEGRGRRVEVREGRRT